MKYRHILGRQRGMTLVELMVAMAIGLLIVIAATVIYLETLQGQRSLERQSTSAENGSFALQLLGREIMNAGNYPANFPPVIGLGEITQQGMYDTYPPLEFSVRKATDWQNFAAAWPPVSYMTGVYGCSGGIFDVKTGSCPVSSSALPDSIVLNYFTSDATGGVNTRNDCTGSSVESDVSNKDRINAGKNNNKPPLLPLFVSNRFSMKSLKNYVDGNDVSTGSLTCSGNGSNPHGTISSYQPIIQGITDLKFRYGVYESDSSLLPNKFYTADEVSALPVLKILGQNLSGWQRVVSVHVCVLSQTQGGGVRLQDKSGAEKIYTDCSGVEKKQPTGQSISRFVQIFGVRNGLKQSY